MKKHIWTVVLIAAVTGALLAQTPAPAPKPAPKPASPAGTAATQIGGQFVAVPNGQRYQGGKWIEVVYNRPIKRGRANLFGAGADYGKALSDGSPVWRVGANQTTRFKTEAALVFDGKTLPAGEYSLFIDLQEKGWTLILSNWPAQEKYDPKNKEALWGSYGYTPDKDVLRAPLALATLPYSVDQFTVAFLDMTGDGGTLAFMWDKTIATAAFKAAK